MHSYDLYHIHIMSYSVFSLRTWPSLRNLLFEPGFFFWTEDRSSTFLSYCPSFKPWPNGLASQRKFAKAEPAYGLAKDGQTDSQVGSQVAKNCKFHAYHWLMRFYNNRLLAINLCRLALGGQTVKNVRLHASKFELDQVVSSRCKSTQVHQNLHRLASPFGQGLKPVYTGYFCCDFCCDFKRDFKLPV